MGKTSDLVKKIRDTKGTFHVKKGSIKDRNSLDLTEAEDIKKRQQEYTEQLHKKEHHNTDNHNGAITHLEPDILECEVKWALKVKVLVTQSCPTLCSPMNYIPGFSIHGILQAGILE